MSTDPAVERYPGRLAILERRVAEAHPSTWLFIGGSNPWTTLGPKAGRDPRLSFKFFRFSKFLWLVSGTLPAFARLPLLEVEGMRVLGWIIAIIGLIAASVIGVGGLGEVSSEKATLLGAGFALAFIAGLLLIASRGNSPN